MDKYGYHALSCNGPDNRRILRHDTVARAIKDLAVDFHPKLNAPIQCIGVSTYVNQSLRPADILIKHKDNQHTCIDVTIVSPLSISKEFHEDGLVVGSLVLKAAKDKIKKHQESCANQDLSFVPFAADVCGIITTDASHLLRRFASNLAERMSRPYSYAMSLCRRRISFAIQHGVATQLLNALESEASHFVEVFT